MRSLAARKLSDPFQRQLERLLTENNRKAHNRTGKVAPRKVCSEQTRRDRNWFYHFAYAELVEMGYRLETPQGLKEKHVQALANRWREKEIAIRTLHTRMSMLRILAGWLGKPGLVKENEHYFPGMDLTRTAAATRNRAWEANGVNVGHILDEALATDKRFGLMLRLQREFGLRVKESIEIYPLRAISPDGQQLYVVDGTKGGLPRIVPIRSDSQRQLLEEIKNLVATSKSKRLRWDGLTYKQASDRFYALATKLGMTKSGMGVTAHGLRHGYAQHRAHEETGGLPTPIEGGAIGRIDAETHKKVSQTVSLELGHRRPDVVNFYYGSYKHELRTGMSTERLLQKWGV